MHRLLPLLLSFIAIGAGCLAQSPEQATPPKVADQQLRFDVASVRPNISGGQTSSNFPLDRGDVYYPTGGIFSATNQSLVTFLIFAYKINVSEFRGGLMRRLPNWARTDRFDINAKAESETPTKQDMRLMLQSLLEDRFKLKAYRKQQETPVFGLYLAKPGKTGAQLKPHPPGPSCALPLPTPEEGMPAARMVGLWPTGCGDGSETRSSKNRLREGGRDMTMSAIAEWLTGAGESDRPIVDETGLHGTFDFILEFDPESLGREGMSNLQRDDSGPTFLEALKEQLGLQTKKQEGSINIFVVDNVEYPSAN
ncbi:MAG: TIGR03435 family protein [Terracidiphilus sp.]|jgi:uncharacterized protein (TIGR03435 family)